MLNSNERLDRIKHYLAQYVTQINLGNDVGLFDGAKMLELFAQEVCRIWFCQEFNNLNLIQNDYPYVDLVSYDKKIYVQVTTAKDLNTKIRETLKKISESTEPVFQEIRNLYFFVHEVPVDINIINRIGKNRIGSINFDAGTHLITAQKIYETGKRMRYSSR